MSSVSKMTDLLINNKKLYAECGKVFTYLNELKINYSSSPCYHIPWRLSELIEIVYANKLEGVNLNIFSSIIEYSLSLWEKREPDSYVAIHFDTTLYAAKYKKKFENIDFKLIEIIRKKILTSNTYLNLGTNYQPVKITNDEIVLFNKLFNGSYSNNPLYFIGLFTYLYDTTFNQQKLINVTRAITLNAYLNQAKLLFSPTLCLSYPLLHNQTQFESFYKEVLLDEDKISDFSSYLFDIVKQAAVINRALVAKSILDFDNFKTALKSNNILKNLSKYNLDNLFKTIAFNVDIFNKILQINNEEKAKIFINEMLEKKLIVSISRKNDFFMWKETYECLKRLDKNKSQSTIEIFKLNEDVN